MEVFLNRKQQLGLQTYIVIFLHTAGTWFHNSPHRHQCLEELAGCPHASPPQNSLWLSVCLLQATYTCESTVAEQELAVSTKAFQKRAFGRAHVNRATATVDSTYTKPSSNSKCKIPNSSSQPTKPSSSSSKCRVSSPAPSLQNQALKLL